MKRGVISNDTPGGKQQMNIVNEPGLYTLVLGSRKAEAKEFKRWLTHEVIPSIRKCGGYLTPEAEKQLTEGLTAMAATVQALGAAFETLAQRVESLEQGQDRRTPLQKAASGENPFEDSSVAMRPDHIKIRKQWMRVASEKLNTLADKCGISGNLVLRNIYEEMEQERGICLSDIRIKALERHQMDDCSYLVAIFYDKPLRRWFEARVEKYLAAESPTWTYEW